MNQLGVFLGMRAVIPPMKAAGGGSIINISSECGMTGKGGMLPYATTKWAVRGMIKCAARDVGRYGIRVNSVHPGSVVIEGLMSSRHVEADPADIVRDQPIRRAARRREITPLLVYVASDESSYATGAEFVIDGGMTSGSSIRIEQ